MRSPLSHCEEQIPPVCKVERLFVAEPMTASNAEQQVRGASLKPQLPGDLEYFCPAPSAYSERLEL